MDKPKGKRDKNRLPTRASAHVDPLSTAEARLALVTEAMTEGIYDWNVVTDTLYLSDRLKSILGIVELTSLKWAEHVHPDDLATYKQAIAKHFKGETEKLSCEYRVRRSAGDYFWIADSARCMRGENGRAIRLVGAVRDITRRKLAEFKLVAVSQVAEQARRNLTDALESMSEGLVLYDAEDRIVICTPPTVVSLSMPADPISAKWSNLVLCCGTSCAPRKRKVCFHSSNTRKSRRISSAAKRSAAILAVRWSSTSLTGSG